MFVVHGPAQGRMRLAPCAAACLTRARTLRIHWPAVADPSVSPARSWWPVSWGDAAPMANLAQSKNPRRDGDAARALHGQSVAETAGGYSFGGAVSAIALFCANASYHAASFGCPGRHGSDA